MNIEFEVFYPTDVASWRAWLEKNHKSKEGVWVVFYKKASGEKSITWSESVDVALCFGWIDSKKRKIDDKKSHQFFSKRKPNSTWSKINKQKVLQLGEQNLMSEAGLRVIEAAKTNGSWNVLDEVEELIIPADLQSAFVLNPIAQEYYGGLSKSSKKAILQWIILARRHETRSNRISEIIERGNLRQKPRHL